jgi:chromatin segregation and condensation protein Rec8/ScpA/Scc1 (kleisin family)
LAVLELYRDGRVGLDQVAPLGDLYVSWADRPASAERSDGDERPDGAERPEEEDNRDDA